MSNNGASSEAQQAAISEALWRVMSRGGPQSLTLRAVAAEAGCTTGLVTSRFPHKQALLIHARDMLNERTSDVMDSIERTANDPVEALRQVLDVSILGEVFEARIWLGFLAATLSDDDLAKVHVTANRRFLDTVRRIVARIDPASTAEQNETAAVGAVSVVTGISLLATADPTHYSAGQMRTLIDFTVKAIATGASPTS